MASEEERTSRLKALRSAIASVELEGFKVDPRVVADGECYAAGELTIQGAIDRCLARFRSSQRA